MALIYCPECGNQISDSVKKCIHCGKKLTKKDKEATGSVAPNQKKKKVLLIVLPIVAVLIIAVIIIIAVSSSSSSSYENLARADRATYEDTVAQREALEEMLGEEVETYTYTTTEEYQYNDEPIDYEKWGESLKGAEEIYREYYGHGF